MTRRQGLIIVALIILAAVGVRWFFNNFEVREIDVPTGLKGEARQNQLYAAKLFLNEMGLHASSRTLPEILRDLPPNDHAIVIDNERRYANLEQSDNLLEWVRQGGQLLLRPSLADEVLENKTLTDPLLEKLGISARFSTQEISEDETIELRISDATNPRSLQIQFEEALQLFGELASDIAIFDNNGTHLIQRNLGTGQLTVLSDMSFMYNNGIGDHDHAEALWRLLHWNQRQPNTVWLVHTEKVTPLWQLIWQNTKPLLLIAFLALIAWGYRASQRFGPQEPGSPPARRRLMEHIEASGRHYWRSHGADRLLRSTRQALILRLNQAHPGWSLWEPATQEQHLAETVGMTLDQVNSLLHDAAPRSKDAFTQLIQQLEKIRRSL